MLGPREGAGQSIYRWNICWKLFASCGSCQTDVNASGVSSVIKYIQWQPICLFLNYFLPPPSVFILARELIHRVKGVSLRLRNMYKKPPVAVQYNLYYFISWKSFCEGSWRSAHREKRTKINTPASQLPDSTRRYPQQLLPHGAACWREERCPCSKAGC